MYNYIALLWAVFYRSTARIFSFTERNERLKSEKFTIDDTLKCKGFAILIMLFHHMFLAPDRYPGRDISFAPFIEADVNIFANFLKVCVGIYVFLSAYGLTLSYKSFKGNDSKFVLFRYIKMMFEFFAIYILSVIVSLFVQSDWNIYSVYGGDGKLSALWRMLIDMLGVAELFRTPTFNSTWWYMSLAIVIILAIPALNKIFDRFGAVYVIAVSIIIPAALGLRVVPLTRWILAVAIGVVCARYDSLSMLKTKFNQSSIFVKAGIFVGMTVMLRILYLLRQSEIQGDYIEIWDSTIPIIIIIYLFLFINGIPGISHFFKFFGNYSTIIFLTHTFIRFYWFSDIVYYFKNAWIDFLILVAFSLAVAIAIKLLFKICRLEKLQKFVLNKISHKS